MSTIINGGLAHLALGERPISVEFERTIFPITNVSVSSNAKIESLFLLRKIAKNAAFDVEFCGNRSKLESVGCLTGGPAATRATAYVISQIDERDKFSSGYIWCTGVVLCGRPLKTICDECIVTHQDPEDFLVVSWYREPFERDMKSRFNAFKNKCAKGSVDAIIFGGQFSEYSPLDTNGERYFDSVKFLDKIIRDALGFEPRIVGPEKAEPDTRQDVYFSTEERKLYISRTNVGSVFDELYYFRDYSEQKEKWKAAY